MQQSYVVICRDDRKPDGSPGDYVLATRRVFENEALAESFKAGVNSSREPLVVEGDWKNLRYLGQRTERSLVVAYLRQKQQEIRHDDRDSAIVLEQLAAEIESGEHRKEGREA